MKAKNTNSLTHNKKICKESRDFSKLLAEYENFQSNQRSPVTEHMLDRLSKELIIFAHESDILRVEWFFALRGISPATARDWTYKFPSFKESYKAARSIIGMRREDGALKKKLDSSTVHFTLPLYDDEWREALEYRHKLKEEEQSKTQPITVVLEAFPSSPIVPPKESTQSPEEVAAQERKKINKSSVPVKQKQLVD